MPKQPEKFYSDLIRGTELEGYQFTDIFGKPDDSPDNILRCAAAIRWIPLAECALKNRADINSGNDLALRMACSDPKDHFTKEESFAMVQFLLSKGANSRIFHPYPLLKADNPYYGDPRPENAHPAYATQHPEIADLLVEYARKDGMPLPPSYQTRLCLGLKGKLLSLPCEKRRDALIDDDGRPTETLIDLAGEGLLPEIFAQAHWQEHAPEAIALIRDLRRALPLGLKEKIDTVDEVPFAPSPPTAPPSFADRAQKLDIPRER